MKTGSINKLLLTILKYLLVLYVVVCGFVYFLQEKIIFFPQKLDKSYEFTFNQDFEEILIKTHDQVTLDGLLFKSDRSKGLIFYLHGNAGSLQRWGEVATQYAALNYDVFMVDYRGYGKSEGTISSTEQVFSDVQGAYDRMLEMYDEKDIVVIGFSIGSGIAAKLASVNQPKLLILEAPYYSMEDMMHHRYPLIPTFLLKYKFATNEYLEECKMPVTIAHGTADQVIYYGSSIKLQQHFKAKDTLITLEGQEHNGMINNAEYRKALEKMLIEKR